LLTYPEADLTYRTISNFGRNIGSSDRFAYGSACLTAESNCLSWPIELALTFQVLASKSYFVLKRQLFLICS